MLTYYTPHHHMDHWCILTPSQNKGLERWEWSWKINGLRKINIRGKEQMCRGGNVHKRVWVRGETQGKRWKKDEQRPWEEAAGLAAALRACLRKPPSPASSSSSSSPCKQLRAFNWFTISVNNRAIQERRKESGKEKGQNIVTSCIDNNTYLW